MNASTRATLDTVPIPTEGGNPVSVCVTTDADHDWRTAWMHDGGRRKELFGPAYTLRGALDAAKHLNERAWAR